MPSANKTLVTHILKRNSFIFEIGMKYEQSKVAVSLVIAKKDKTTTIIMSFYEIIVTAKK